MPLLRLNGAPARSAAPLAVPRPILYGYERDRDNAKSRRRRRLRYVALAVFAFLYGFFYALLPPAFLPILLMPIAVLVLLIIWALPVSQFAPPRALAFCFWAFFTSMFLWPNYLALSLPGLPWITVARLSGGPLLAIILICASASKPFREEMREILASAGWIWKLVAAFAVIQLVSIAFSNDWFTTLNRVISQQMMWTGIFFASVWIFRRPGAIVTWGRVLIGLAVFVSIIGEIEAIHGGVLWANSIPSFLKIEDEAVQRILAGTQRNGVYRIVSTSMNPLNLAEFLALATPFVIHEFRMAKSVLYRLALFAIDVLIIHAIVLTDARLGLVGALTTHSVYGLVWMYGRWRSNPTSLIAPAITLAYPALLAMLVAVVFTVPRVYVTILGGGRTQASNIGRTEQFAAAPDVFIQSPIFGYGSGQGAEQLGFTNQAGQLTIDSYVLSMLLDYGIAGFICFYGLIIASGIAAARIAVTRSDKYSSMGIPIALFMLAFVQIRLVLSNEFNIPLLFMMLGAVVALAHNARNAGPEGSVAPSPSRNASLLRSAGPQLADANS